MVESKHEQPNQIYVTLTYEMAQALYDFLKHEYISYEHHPKVINLIFELREKLNVR